MSIAWTLTPPLRSNARRAVRGAAALAAAAGLVAMTACGADGPSSEAAEPSKGSGEWKSVTIEDAFGSTEITQEPQRVVTLGWGSADAAIALGVVPVGMEIQSYGGNKQGVLPWVEDALQERGAETPAIIESADKVEQIVKTRPDLILAPYSGLTKEQRDKLAAIPGVQGVVAYPDKPWSTPWRDTIEIVGKALGRSQEADHLLEGIDAEVAKAAAEHPEFKGRTIATLAGDTSTLYFYTPADPREQFLTDLGFSTAPAIEELSEGVDGFFGTLSFEQADKLRSDVLVTYMDTAANQRKLLSIPSVGNLPQVKHRTTAQIIGAPLVASVGPPTALSLTWGLDDFVEALSEATARVG